MVETVEGLDDLRGLALAQQPVVDEDTRELVADRLVDEQRRHRRVDAARERAEDPLVPDLGANTLDLLLDHRRRRPRRRNAGHVVEEVLQDRLAVRRVDDLGMELDAVAPLLAILERGHRRVLGRRHDAGARGGLDDRVAVRHPGRLVGRQRREQRALTRAQGDLPVLAGSGLVDAPAELERKQLRSVTDAERGDAEVEDRRVELGSAVGVDRRRPTREDQRCGIAPADLGRRRPMGDELRVDARLAYPTCDELRVLAAEVDDEDRPFLRSRVRVELNDLSRAGNWERPS